MCGIAGSNNSLQAFTLYQSNLDRGFYSSGSLVLDDNSSYTCAKVLGQFEHSKECLTLAGTRTEGIYYLYHSRGPTTETKEFIEENNHPFFYGDWIVAHNGIISNFAKLCEFYFPLVDPITHTDSCIIPRILNEFGLQGLSKLEGTLAIWAHNIRTNNTYIARNSCTLYANLKTGDFCSTMFEDSVMLDENVIYKIVNTNSIVVETKFKSNSPYFIL
ncbi:MAG: hypothetical protein EBR30_00790 [Cytophagia bacterium]|jgi:glucosamine 6-phosphate synthetase-like amidotransferase/phosphosugar isomerase protein|nr:hypothetical protein [Cytophagia bacterium]